MRCHADEQVAGSGETVGVSSSHHRGRLWIAATVGLVLGTILVAGLAAGRPSLNAVPPPGSTTALGSLRYNLALAPNRASMANRLVLTLSAGGHPLSAATVTVTFSMPAMDMFNAFSLVAHPLTPGIFVATVPLVGMAGAWRLDIRVSRPGRPAIVFAVADRLRD